MTKKHKKEYEDDKKNTTSSAVSNMTGPTGEVPGDDDGQKPGRYDNEDRLP